MLHTSAFDQRSSSAPVRHPAMIARLFAGAAGLLGANSRTTFPSRVRKTRLPRLATCGRSCFYLHVIVKT